MTEWGIVGVIVTLIGLVASIVTPLIKLNTTITSLTNLVKSCEKELEELTVHNTKSHARLWEQIEKNHSKVEDHEHRITVLEEHDKIETHNK